MLLWKEGGTSCRGARFASLAPAGEAEKGRTAVAAHRSALLILALRWPSRFSCSSGRSFPRLGTACRCCSRFGRPLLRITVPTASLLSQVLRLAARVHDRPWEWGPATLPATVSGKGRSMPTGPRPRSRTMRRLQRPRALPFPLGVRRSSAAQSASPAACGQRAGTCRPRWGARTPGNAGPSPSETVTRMPRRPLRRPGPARARNGPRAARTPRRRGR